MKNIVITGASGGVGSMLAKGLAKKGHHIICLGRNEDRLKELVHDIHADKGVASFEVVDMMDAQQLDEIGTKIMKGRGSIEVWINNVGVNNHNAIGPSWELSKRAGPQDMVVGAGLCAGLKILPVFGSFCCQKEPRT